MVYNVCMKTCTKCNERMATTEFRKDRSKKDGLYSCCNDCQRLRTGAKKRRPSGWYPNSHGYLRKGGNNILQHRYVMEQHLGRKLLTNEHVHHKNGIKTDNRLANLEVLDKLTHHYIHGLKQVKTGSTKSCTNCGAKKYFCPAHLKQISEHQYRCYKCYTSVHYNRLT